MPGQYLYSVELNINDCDLWSCTYPELRDVEDKKTFIRFQMNPSIVLEITEDEYLDQVNCDTTVVKNAMFSLSEKQINSDVGAKIVVSKLMCPENEVMIGCYNIPTLNCSFKRIMKQFDDQVGSPCAGEPCIEVVKELVQLVNSKDQPSGSIHYTLRLACYGPTISKNKGDNCSLKSVISELVSLSTITTHGLTPCTAEPRMGAPRNAFDEYAAEINGNQLIVRISKDATSPHLVTRVYDTDMDQMGNDIRKEKNNIVSICGFDQQIDFKFPEKCSFGDCGKKTNSSPNDCQNVVLTDYQRQTSCNGKSYKNSCKIPAIHGNLKYPGKLDNDAINFKLYDGCNPRDVTRKYLRNPVDTRAVCLQADGDNLKRELDGELKLPKGIKVCRKGISDPNTDVFILKIGKNNSNKSGQKSEIELEMRTPKGPDTEVKKMETREVQVEEREFENEKPLAKKSEATTVKAAATKGFVKKGEVGASKTITKKKK